MHDHRDGFQSCIQCGICTSGCPAARFTDYVPREIARRALEGDPTLLEDDDVWYCFYCYTCQSRCPRKNSVAVINQVIRSMQVESGYGVKHVEMFAAWGEQFYDKGMGGTPHVFFADIAEAWGPRWKQFIADRDAMREAMGLGSMFPAEEAVKEVQVIMEDTGFFDRLEEHRRLARPRAPAAPLSAPRRPRRRPAPAPPTPAAPSRPAQTDRAAAQLANPTVGRDHQKARQAADPGRAQWRWKGTSPAARSGGPKLLRCACGCSHSSP